MKFTEKMIGWGWEDTDECRAEYLEEEVLEDIYRGSFKSVDEVLEEHKDRATDFTAQEIKIIAEAVAERLEILDEMRDETIFDEIEDIFEAYKRSRDVA